MKVKTILDEDFTNYKEPSMFIGCISCGGKCAKEGGFDISICQNDEWRKSPIINYDNDELIKRYLSNSMTKSIVFGLLEPFEQADEIIVFIDMLRNKYKCKDTVIIYTGYNKKEIKQYIDRLRAIGRNIIIKFGRFQLNNEKHFDEVLGVYLASDNQYAERIS